LPDFGEDARAFRRNAAIRLWPERARSWQQLRELSDHMLKDIGMSQEEAFREAEKPFWRR